MTLDELFPEWQRQALCIGFGESHWFPVRGQSTKPAKEICGRCAVRDACLDYALAEDIKHGIWGGLTEPERRRVKAARS